MQYMAFQDHKYDTVNTSGMIILRFHSLVWLRSGFDAEYRVLTVCNVTHICKLAVIHTVAFINS